MLACARIGAPHSVVFGGFSAEAVKDRINDCEAKVAGHGRLLAAPRQAEPDEGGGRRGARRLPVDRARAWSCAAPAATSRGPRAATSGGTRRSRRASADCPAEPFDAEQMLFLLYTSGTTAKPKGIVHTTRRLPDRRAGHAQPRVRHQARDATCSGARPTSAGSPATATSSTARSPTAARRSCTRARRTTPRRTAGGTSRSATSARVFYTAPTAIRACIKWGREHPDKHDLVSLRLLGSVGEPINPRAWLWYHEVIGGGRCPIVDTWWQTETGHIMITPLPGITTHQARLGDGARSPASRPRSTTRRATRSRWAAASSC